MMIKRVRGLFMVFLRDGDAGFTRSVLCYAIKSHSALRVGLFTAETQRREVPQRMQDVFKHSPRFITVGYVSEFSDLDFMMIKRVRGLFMVFLRDLFRHSALEIRHWTLYSDKDSNVERRMSN
jgi:hypothetical protein